MSTAHTGPPRSPKEVATALRAARSRLLCLVDDLNAEQLIGPKLTIVNPPLWEIGHVAWFQERWILRHLGGQAALPQGDDKLFDSVSVMHGTRWTLHFPQPTDLLVYLEEVQERVLALLLSDVLDKQALDVVRLVLFHEYMHCEALNYTRQTLGYAAPPAKCRAVRPPIGEDIADVLFPGGTHLLGAAEDVAFAFDNEQWAHAVELRPFRMASRPVSQGEFAAFVDDGGYGRRELWSEAGWSWREAEEIEHPLHWQQMNEGWLVRRFDAFEPLKTPDATSHISWFEAEAYCRWAKRRLPTEVEWEHAADHSLTHRFHVWEWTADSFQPYPGFKPGVYRQYSSPWFGDHRVLRGGSLATPEAMQWNTLRNFYLPDRRDIFAGFRTVALED